MTTTSPTYKDADMDKLCQKLQKVYLRRDHYAQLYQQTKAELDETKQQLNVAQGKIKQLETQISKTKSYELRDHNSSRESNDHSSPDSGSVSLSSGVESNGHFDENLVDTSGHPDNSPIQKRFVRNNSGVNEMMMQPGQHFQTVKKVAFYDHPHLVPISVAPVSHQERMNGPILHRSYTFDQGELNHHYMAAMNMKIQRTNSYSYGRGVPPQIQYSTFPRSQYPVHHQLPPHYSGINFAPSSDHHRLPRVHRGLAYENSVIHGVPQPNYPPPPPPPHRMSQHHNQTSAFKQVKTREGGRQNQYENVVQQHHPQEHRNGEKCTYSGVNNEELSQILGNIKDNVERLEISRSDLGKIELMKALCREVKKKPTLRELSLPNNDIGKNSLAILLNTVSSCKNITDLKLMNNNIGEDCLDILKRFLEKSSLKSLILTGNEIEHHTHLLDVHLPQELSFESIPENRAANISHGTDSLPQNIKLLHI